MQLNLLQDLNEASQKLQRVEQQALALERLVKNNLAYLNNPVVSNRALTQLLASTKRLVVEAEQCQKISQETLATGKTLLSTLKEELLNPLGNFLGISAANVLLQCFTPIFLKPIVEVACKSLVSGQINNIFDAREQQLELYNRNTVQAIQATQAAASELEAFITRQNNVMYTKAAGKVIALSLLVYILENLDGSSYQSGCKLGGALFFIAMLAWRQNQNVAHQAQDITPEAEINDEDFVMVQGRDEHDQNVAHQAQDITPEAEINDEDFVMVQDRDEHEHEGFLLIEMHEPNQEGVGSRSAP